MIKKRVIATLCIVMGLLIIIGFVYSTVHKIQRYYSLIWEWSITDFKGHKDSFQTVADKLKDYYFDEKKENDLYYFHTDYIDENNGWHVTCYLNDGNEYEDIIPITDKERKAVYDIYVAFKHPEGFGFSGTIVVTDKQISFLNASAPYAVIYVYSYFASPKFVEFPNQLKGNNKYFFDRLGTRWFEGIITNR